MAGRTRPFTCEAQFQHELAAYLRDHNKNNPKVHLEYFVPKVFIASKSSKAYIDIVIEQDNEFVPIELKFKTTSLKPKKSLYSCFGNEEKCQLIRKMAAQNINRYAVWKDVKRIEWIKSQPQYCKTVKTGFVVFHTNDPLYFASGVDYALSKCKGYRPIDPEDQEHPLNILNKYDISWRKHSKIKIKKKKPTPLFHYTIIEV